ncbi:MAG: fibrillarin-like rRNA/tRNA 2'-O-methyltransferase [Methanomicrobiales archaeon]
MIWIDGVLVSPGEGGVYGERIFQGYRVWDPRRSKFAALLHLGGEVELADSLRVLYLGAANGTTVSHVADYVEVVYAVEIAPRPMQDLLAVANRRPNVVPILADATRPDTFAPVMEAVDLIYQDVAHPDQAAIAARNAVFLREGGALVLMLKTRSVDLRKTPAEVLDETVSAISGTYRVEQTCWLEPYHRDHAAVIARLP